MAIINFKSLSAIFGIIGAIFLAISTTIAIAQFTVTSLIVGIVGILCLIASLFYYLHKPPEPESAGCTGIVGFKFKNKK